MNLKLKIYTFAGIVLPVLVLAVYSYVQIRQQTNERVYEERRALASLSAGILNEKLDRINDLALSFSTRVLLSPLVEQQKWDAAIELVKKIPEDFDYIDRVFITDTTGTLMADAPSAPELKGKNYARFDWYKGFIKSQQPYLSPVYKRTVPPYSIVSVFAVPIKNKEGKLRGILVLQVDIDKLLHWCKSVKAGSNGFLYVVDQKGHIAIHPKYAQKDSIADYSSVPVVQHALRGEKKVEIFYNAIEKESRLTAYEPIPGYGWAVFVTQEANAALAAGSSLNFIVFIYVFIILLACGLAYFIIREITQRQNAEEQLKKYQHFFNNSNDFSCIANTEGYFEIINPNFEKLLGYSEKELLENQFLGFIHPDDIAATLVEVEKLKTGAKTINFVNRYRKKDGTYLWFDWNTSPDPLTGKLYAIARDITERKKVEEKLKESEEKYRNLINFSPVGISLSSLQGKILETNKAILDMLGFESEEEFINTPAAELYVDKNERTELIELFKKNGVVKNFEVRLKRKNGEVIWVSSHVDRFKMQNGEIAILSASIDITHRKKVEEQLKEYQHFFNNSNDLCLIANMEGYFETVNPNLEKVLGYSEKEWMEKPFIEFIHPEDMAAVLNEYGKQKTEAASLMNFSCRFRKIDGSYVWLEWNSIPDPVTGKIYAIGRDITERKKAEEQLLAANKELEAFSYSVSHDLRAPLRAVNGYAQMLIEDYGTKIDEEGKRITESIRYNALKMGTLIDELLEFSRLGRKELEIREINMKELVKTILAELNNSITHTANIKIGKLHNVKADYSLLYQVMFNLISNAVKYSSKKEHPLVEIFSEEKNGEIIFCVKDNGAGFDMKYYDKLFGVFQRLHRQNEFDGVGVGLALVQRIIAKHGGKVWAEGKVNEGAQFNFSLTINQNK